MGHQDILSVLWLLNIRFVSQTIETWTMIMYKFTKTVL